MSLEQHHGKPGKKRDPWFFHPYEITFSGFSGSGKTTLLSRLAAAFSAQGRSVGYAKHDAHHFEVDQPGKDTFVLRQAGATAALINNDGGSALIKNGPLGDLDRATALLDCDLVLVEGHKHNRALRKFVLLDAAGEMARLLPSLPPEEVIAVISPDLQLASGLPWPVLHRDDLPGILAAVEAELARRVAALPVQGLILSGGRSSRMGLDKGALDYHGRSMIAQAARLLAPHCAEIFVSCRAEQGLPEDAASLPRLHDVFLDLGPAGGILSAFARQPQAAWLVFACDLPLVTPEALSRLCAGRNPLKFATAYSSTHDGFPEPLLALYEPKARCRLLQFLALGKTCPRKMLINSPTQILPGYGSWLDNCNTPEERAAALRQIHQA
ncbi:MAG: bifunctional molybdopterin-guanine dinucleotide biosynthesis protein MobB/MobA [Verrucomicrobiota bacterium]|jgi:molybdopterin-guanine dinucleotide biosynthesis protein MobB